MEEIDRLLGVIAEARRLKEDQDRVINDALNQLRTVQAKIEQALKPGPVYRGNTG